MIVWITVDAQINMKNIINSQLMLALILSAIIIVFGPLHRGAFGLALVVWIVPALYYRYKLLTLCDAIEKSNGHE